MEKPANFSLPGFMTPGSAKQDERAFANPDGRVEILVTHLAKDDPIPAFEVFVSRDRGSEISVIKTYSKNEFIYGVENDKGGRDVLLRFLPEELLLDPGTYTVRVMLGSVDIVKRTVTVVAHPAHPQPTSDTPVLTNFKTVEELLAAFTNDVVRNQFSATAPLTYNPNTGVFAAQQATTSQSGFLSSADWNTFNNKASVAYVDAAVAGATLPQASGSQSGYLSAADWTTFNNKATTTFVNNAIAAVIGAAPNALNTLDELAAALGDDANFGSNIINSLSSKMELYFINNVDETAWFLADINGSYFWHINYQLGYDGATNPDLISRIGAAETLTSKTLTSPTINDVTLNGDIAGSPVFTGNPTFDNPLVGLELESPIITRNPSFVMNSNGGAANPILEMLWLGGGNVSPDLIMVIRHGQFISGRRDWNFGLWYDANQILSFNSDTVARLGDCVNKTGDSMSGTLSLTSGNVVIGNGTLVCGSGGQLMQMSAFGIDCLGAATGISRIASLSFAISNSAVVFLFPDAANVLALRNAGNAQTFNVYGSFTDTNNYTRAALSCSPGTPGNVSLTAESLGTGSANIDIVLTPKGTGRVRFGTLVANGDQAVTGYIEVKDAGGTLRKLAVIT